MQGGKVEVIIDNMYIQEVDSNILAYFVLGKVVEKSNLKKANINTDVNLSLIVWH